MSIRVKGTIITPEYSHCYALVTSNHCWQIECCWCTGGIESYSCLKSQWFNQWNVWGFFLFFPIWAVPALFSLISWYTEANSCLFNQSGLTAMFSFSLWDFFFLNVLNNGFTITHIVAIRSCCTLVFLSFHIRMIS